MRYARYLRLEKYIAASDTGGILERWKYGRRLLEDKAATNSAGSLLRGKGIVQRLISDATSGDLKLSEREIQYRLECARTYPSEALIRSAAATYGTWRALCDAGFPAPQLPLDADAVPYDPRDSDEKQRDAARELARRSHEDSGQLALFPDDKYDEFSTLAELAKYAAEMSALIERYARKDRERADYLESLIDAVGGDMSKTWAEAQVALDAGT